jgi:hypothetical protein
MDEQIRQFAQGIGAIEPASNSVAYEKWRSVFRRPNYFLFHDKVIVVKISRSTPPFWGVGKKYIDLLESLDDYYVVLLISEREGWVFNKLDVRASIKSRKWKLRAADGNYKINLPLPDRNSFFSLENLLKKI